MKAFEKLDTLKEKKYFKTWLIRILIHECYQMKRRSKRLVPYEEYVENAPGKEDKLYTDLYAAIDDLPEDLRIAVTLILYRRFLHCGDRGDAGDQGKYSENTALQGKKSA